MLYNKQTKEMLHSLPLLVILKKKKKKDNYNKIHIKIELKALQL